MTDTVSTGNGPYHPRVQWQLHHTSSFIVRLGRGTFLERAQDAEAQASTSLWRTSAEYGVSLTSYTHKLRRVI